MTNSILSHLYNILLIGVCFILNIFISQPQALESKIEVDIVDKDNSYNEDTTEIINNFMKSEYLQTIVWRESRGDTTVISSAYCVGMYQIHPLYFELKGESVHSYIINGKFIMSKASQYHLCRFFIRKQIEFMKNNSIPITQLNIFKSWYGVGHL